MTHIGIFCVDVLLGIDLLLEKNKEKLLYFERSNIDRCLRLGQTFTTKWSTVPTTFLLGLTNLTNFGCEY